MGDIVDAKEKFAEAQAEAEQSPLTQLREQNRTALEELSRAGAAPNPVMLLQLRIDVFIDLMAPEGGALREVFETFFEQNVAGFLDTVQKDFTRSKLTDGVSPHHPSVG